MVEVADAANVVLTIGYQNAVRRPPCAGRERRAGTHRPGHRRLDVVAPGEQHPRDEHFWNDLWALGRGPRSGPAPCVRVGRSRGGTLDRRRPRGSRRQHCRRRRSTATPSRRSRRSRPRSSSVPVACSRSRRAGGGRRRPTIRPGSPSSGAAGSGRRSRCRSTSTMVTSPPSAPPAGHQGGRPRDHGRREPLSFVGLIIEQGRNWVAAARGKEALGVHRPPGLRRRGDRRRHPGVGDLRYARALA